MNVTINRLDPNVPDPVESRRRAAGRLVRFAYAIIVFGVLAFFVVYFGAPFVFLSGPGTVSAPRHIVSLPYTVQVSQMKLVPGATVKAGEEIAEVLSPEQDSISQPTCARWRTLPAARRNCASRLESRRKFSKLRAPICS
jgi:HlyD family secretion protein